MAAKSSQGVLILHLFLYLLETLAASVRATNSVNEVVELANSTMLTPHLKPSLKSGLGKVTFKLRDLAAQCSLDNKVGGVACTAYSVNQVEFDVIIGFVGLIRKLLVVISGVVADKAIVCVSKSYFRTTLSTTEACARPIRSPKRLRKGTSTSC